MKYAVAVILYGAQVEAAERVFRVKNECPFNVWPAVVSGASSARSGGNSCNNDGDCSSGGSCASNKICFWNHPQPSTGSYKLTTGASLNFSFPVIDSNNIVFSGLIGGRTGCNEQGTNCQVGDCGGSTCKTGLAQPSTQAEFTLGKTNIDFYDIEVINGMTLPIEMKPVNPGPATGNPYFCGNPGGLTSITGEAPSTWNVHPPSIDYNWVSAGGSRCSSSSQCGGSQICGNSFNAGHADLIQMTCGEQLGYWSAAQICGLSQNYGAPFNCQSNGWMEGCARTSGSCYQPGANANTCCGCANWWEEGVPVPSSTQRCVAQDPRWMQNILPNLKWMKQASPAVYTYPFDDMSSTFVCNNNPNGGYNSVNYDITFCPGGKTGRQLTANELGQKLTQIRSVLRTRASSELGSQFQQN